MRIPKKFADSLCRSGWIETGFSAAFVEDRPDEDGVPQDTVFVERRDGNLKWAYLSCPRCGELIELPLGTSRGTWRATVDWLWRPSLHPSVWETGSCQAHFWLKRGKIYWCRD
jgi:hypothetical protein